MTLPRYYDVRHIYFGQLERQLYGQSSTTGLDKFDHLEGSTLQMVYRANGVSIYEVM